MTTETTGKTETTEVEERRQRIKDAAEKVVELLYESGMPVKDAASALSAALISSCATCGFEYQVKTPYGSVDVKLSGDLFEDADTDDDLEAEMEVARALQDEDDTEGEEATGE